MTNSRAWSGAALIGEVTALALFASGSRWWSPVFCAAIVCIALAIDQYLRGNP